MSAPVQRFLRAVLPLALLFAAASCERKNSAPAEPSTPAAPDKNGVTFAKGFHQEDALGPAAVLRWAHRETVLRVDVSAAGRYRLTFRPFTVFSMEEMTIEVNANGENAGSFVTHAFDVADAVPATLEVDLREGRNELLLHASRPETRLGENDQRLASFGLLLPVTVEAAP